MENKSFSIEPDSYLNAMSIYSAEEHLRLSEHFTSVAESFAEDDERAGIYFYAVANSLRAWEFSQAALGLKPTKAAEIIQCLEQAAKLGYFEAIDWLKHIYKNGQGITDPDPEKLEYWREYEKREVKKIRQYYEGELDKFAASRGFLKTGKYWVLKTYYGYGYIENDFVRMGTYLRQQISIGKIRCDALNLRRVESLLKLHEGTFSFSGPYLSDPLEMDEYSRRLGNGQRWADRERLTCLFCRALQHMIDIGFWADDSSCNG
jgi:hypothetical protein